MSKPTKKNKANKAIVEPANVGEVNTEWSLRPHASADTSIEAKPMFEQPFENEFVAKILLLKYKTDMDRRGGR